MTTATTTPHSSTVQVRFKRAHNDAIRRRDNEHSRHEHRLEVSVRCVTSDVDRNGSCHHCKSAVPAESLLHCTTRRSLTSRDCRKKYCRACVERHYGGLPRAPNGRHWTCPACSGLCMCPACKRKLSANASDAPLSASDAPDRKRLRVHHHHCQTEHQHQHHHHHAHEMELSVRCMGDGADSAGASDPLTAASSSDTISVVPISCCQQCPSDDDAAAAALNRSYECPSPSLHSICEIPDCSLGGRFDCADDMCFRLNPDDEIMNGVDGCGSSDYADDGNALCCQMSPLTAPMSLSLPIAYPIHTDHWCIHSTPSALNGDCTGNGALIKHESLNVRSTLTLPNAACSFAVSACLPHIPVDCSFACNESADDFDFAANNDQTETPEHDDDDNDTANAHIDNANQTDLDWQRKLLWPAPSASSDRSDNGGSEVASAAADSSIGGTLVSCHQCKKRKPLDSVFTCINEHSTANGKRRLKCVKKYCASCVSRYYASAVSEDGDTTWKCPSCRGVCACAACHRRANEDAMAAVDADHHHHAHVTILTHPHSHSHAHHDRHHPTAVSASASPSSSSDSTSLMSKLSLTQSARVSCHQCKSSKLAASCVQCNVRRSVSSSGGAIRDCRKRYCSVCLDKWYSIDIASVDADTFVCPSCRGQCPCATCRRRYNTSAEASAATADDENASVSVGMSVLDHVRMAVA